MKKAFKWLTEGWNDDVGVRFWSWLLSIGGAFMVGASGMILLEHYIGHYNFPVIVSYTPFWIFLGIGCAFLFAAIIGMAWVKYPPEIKWLRRLTSNSRGKEGS